MYIDIYIYIYVYICIYIYKKKNVENGPLMIFEMIMLVFHSYIRFPHANSARRMVSLPMKYYE